MDMSATIFVKGFLDKEVLNIGPSAVREIKSRIECAGICLTREDCHFYTWEKDIKECDMDHVELGWHFNYSFSETKPGLRNIYMDTGTYCVKKLRIKPIFHMCRLAYMDHLIIIGGFDSNGKVLSETRKFDQEKWTDRIVQLPGYLHKNMHTPMAYASSGRAGGAVIVCGGVIAINPWNVTDKCLTLLADHTNWKSLPSMSKARAKAAHYSDGNILFIAGGEDDAGAAIGTAEKFWDGAWYPMSDLPSPTKG